MEGSAPKHQRPAFCATLAPLAGQAPPKYSCSLSSGGVRRLCPCEPLPGAQQSGQVDGLASADAAAAAQQQQQQMGAAREGGVAVQPGQQAAAAGNLQR